MNIKTQLPWWIKIVAKLVFSRLPISYKIWKKIGLFEHGSMQQANYGFDVLNKHYKQFHQYKLCNQNLDSKTGLVGLELGPGDSIASAIIFRAFGGTKSYLVDTGDFATKEVEKYSLIINLLKSKGFLVSDLENCQNLEELLLSCSGVYLTSGLSSLRKIPTASVDFIWSQAVLEHVRKSEFLEVMKELRRILRDDGICSHVVDLKDHLSSALNHLRFSESIWESHLMASSGFYTNRIQCSSMISMFKQAGFEIVNSKTLQWDKLPTPREKLSRHFQDIPEDELRIYEFSVVLKPLTLL